MPDRTIQRFVHVLDRAFSGLGVTVAPARLETIARLIHAAMSVDTRSFHTPAHALALVQPDRPVQTLVGLFHDLVYYQVDCGFVYEAQAVTGPYIQALGENRFQVREQILERRSFALVMAVFGLSPGQVIPLSAGLNEFVSALVMCQLLDAHLSEKDLLRVIVGIEATIPFRGVDDNGDGPCAELAGRLRLTCQRFQVPLSAAEQVQAVQEAAEIANRDVDNFSRRDPLPFLDNTWKLLSETNNALRNSGPFTISEYRLALQNMYVFLRDLDPGTIFHHYQGVPPEAQIRRKRRNAARNLELATQYLMVKLLSVALLEALSKASMGDAPLSFFLGDMNSQQAELLRLECFLPEITPSPEADFTCPVYSLICAGGASGLPYDMRNSPISCFIYRSLGMPGVRQHLALAFEMFGGQISPAQFLSRADAGVVSSIARACSAMMDSHSGQLNRYLNPRQEAL